MIRRTTLTADSQRPATLLGCGVSRNVHLDIHFDLGVAELGFLVFIHVCMSGLRTWCLARFFQRFFHQLMIANELRDSCALGN